MNWVLDGIILAVLLLFTLVGVKRGFVRSAARLAGAVAAAFLASMLAGPIAQWLFDLLFRQALVEKIGRTVQSVGTAGLAESLGKVLEGLPDFIVRALEAAGITVARLQGVVADTAAGAAEVITDTLSPVFVGFLKVGVLLVLFLLLMVAVRALAELLHSVARLPLLRQVDQLLGGVCGLLLALVVLWVVLGAVRVFVPMLTASTQADVELMLGKSMLAKVITGFNPLAGLFR